MADFLDGDEAAAAAAAAPRVAPGFDTFGEGAAGEARAAAAAEAAARHELLPDLLPAELLAPVQRSVGARTVPYRTVPLPQYHLSSCNPECPAHHTSATVPPSLLQNPMPRTTIGQSSQLRCTELSNAFTRG